MAKAKGSKVGMEAIATAGGALRRRLAPEARARMILEGAITFFAEHGFQGQIRDLAETLGVSQALIFTYFGNKGTLLERVYDEVYLSCWQDAWLDDLRDRSRPLGERLETFYLGYLDAIDEPIWIRIVLHSGLAGNELTHRYVSRRVEQILRIVMAEVRSHFGSALATIDDADMYERVWDLQASFVYGLIRKHVWLLPVMEDRPRLVAGRVSQFLRGLAALARPADARPSAGPGRRPSTPLNKTIDNASRVEASARRTPRDRL